MWLLLWYSVYAYCGAGSPSHLSQIKGANLHHLMLYAPPLHTLRAWTAANRRAYLEYERPYLGWGIFVLRPKQG